MITKPLNSTATIHCRTTATLLLRRIKSSNFPWCINCGPKNLCFITPKPFHTKRLTTPYRISSHNGNNHQTIPYRSGWKRFWDPWHDLAECCPDQVLADKVDSVTRTFGVVAALMTSLSAALLAVEPRNDDRKDKVSSLLVSWGISHSIIQDAYTACGAGAFYGGVCATGLSAVLNAWLAATPPGGTKYFVQNHSLVIVTIPAFLGVSTALAGTALFLGLDQNKGKPISYIGLGGTLVGGVMIGTSALRGWSCTYRLLTRMTKR